MCRALSKWDLKGMDLYFLLCAFSFLFLSPAASFFLSELMLKLWRF